MADVTVKRLEEFEAVYGGGFRRVRAGLGVSSFGVQVIELPPNFEHYPEHDHTHDEQEEVYTVLSGRAKLLVGGEEHELEPGTFARVGPGEKRKLVSADEGARILALGATPGAVYDPPEFSKEGAPQPALHKPEAEAAVERATAEHAAAQQTPAT
jgi:quercetin dioxygenase-like cupin family protein